MKKMLLMMLVILPGFFAQAGGEIRSMADIGICDDGSKVVRFLDGNRLKLEQFTYGDSDYRSCELTEDSETEKVYICGTKSWDLHWNRGVDLQVRVSVRPGVMAHSVELLNPWGQVVMQASCVPHKM